LIPTKAVDAESGPGFGALPPHHRRHAWIFRGYQWVGTSRSGSAKPFLLASIARILYPVDCLACERLRAVILGKASR
jgi:hypothetical protein